MSLQITDQKTAGNQYTPNNPPPPTSRNPPINFNPTLGPMGPPHNLTGGEMYGFKNTREAREYNDRQEALAKSSATEAPIQHTERFINDFTDLPPGQSPLDLALSDWRRRNNIMSGYVGPGQKGPLRDLQNPRPEPDSRKKKSRNGIDKDGKPYKKTHRGKRGGHNVRHKQADALAAHQGKGMVEPGKVVKKAKPMSPGGFDDTDQFYREKDAGGYVSC